MSFDLTNKNIQDTFQKLLQQTGSIGEVYDLEGNRVTNLNINTMSSSVITASIIEIPNVSNQDGNKLHARSGVLYFGDANLETGGSGLSNIVEDTTPQLGGNLDLNSNNISGSGNLNILGDITASGNISGSSTSTASFAHIITQGDTIEFKSGGTKLGSVKFDITEGLQVKNQAGSGGKLTAKVLSVANEIISNGTISASGTITGNSLVGTLTGTATGLAGTPDVVVGSLTATSITSSIVTSSVVYTEGSNIFGDAINDTQTFNGHITASGNISASGDIKTRGIEVNTNDTDDFFLLKSGSMESIKVNGQGVLTLGGFTLTPTAVRGGLYYNHDDDELYLGKNT